jgi:O-antigen/teichoic acid export membrane protein
MNTLVNKMAMVLVPTVSSLQSTGNLKEIHELLIKSVRYSFYMTLPMVLVLVVFGSSIMQLWMGSRYAKGLVPAILAIGSLIAMGQAPLQMILMGMNAHGRAGMGHLVASLCSVGLNLLVLRYLGVGLVGVAVAVTLPLTVMNMVYLPILIRRQLGIGIGHYFLAVTIGPAVHVLPFAVCLVVARLVFNTKPLIGLMWGCLIGGTILAILYWRYVIPARIKMRVFRFIGMRGSLA